MAKIKQPANRKETLVTPKKTTKKVAVKKTVKKVAKKDTIVKPVAKKTRGKAARIFFIADASGSMGHLTSDVIGGFNAYVEEQKKLKVKTTLSLILFSTDYRVIYSNVNVKDVPVLTNEVYFAGGGTALNDAIGKTITDNLKSGKKNELTIVNIFTDGQENSSKEYRDVKAVNSLVEQVQKDLKWEIVFLASNIDAQKTGAAYGILNRNIASYNNTGKGLSDMTKTMAYASTYSRGIMGAAGTAGSMSMDMLDKDGTLNVDKLYKKVSTDEDKVLVKDTK